MTRWTEEEQQILFKAVEDNPQNFTEAFRQVSASTGRSIHACRQHYGECRKNGTSPVCMMAIGKNKRLSPNRKNIFDGTGGITESIRQPKWRRILAILFE